MTTAFSESAQVFHATRAGLLVQIVLAVFVISTVRGVLYESLIHPLTIVSGLPFAAFGALRDLWLFHVESSLFALEGSFTQRTCAFVRS